VCKSTKTLSDVFFNKKMPRKKNYFILKRVINIFVIGAIPSDTHNLPRPVQKKKEFLERKTLNSSFFTLVLKLTPSIFGTWREFFHKFGFRIVCSSVYKFFLPSLLTKHSRK